MENLIKKVEEINTAFVAFKIGRITKIEKNIRIRGILRELEKETTEYILSLFKELRTEQKYYDTPYKAMSKVNEIIYGCEDKLNNKE